jgi:LacI family transcriptional regulator
VGVSILDVGRLAGVSKSTISAVINNRTNVKPETREKVLAAIQKLDYHPNLAARELVTSTKTNIGILLPIYKQISSSENEMYFPYINESSNYDVVSKLIEDLSFHGYGVLTEHVEIGNGEIRLPRFATSRQVLGAILISPLFDHIFLHKIHKYISNIVQIGDFNPDCDSVYSNFFSTLERTVDYLCNIGHTKIALINSDPASSTTIDRLKGYQAGLQKHGIRYSGLLVRSVPFTGIDGYRAFADIWEHNTEKPNALICSTDIGACGAMRYMYEHGIKVPDDVSIVANENGLPCEVTTPTITVIGRDKKEIAFEATAMMMERINNPEIGLQSLMVQDYLIERKSVKLR